ncbi:bZIP transcription factor HapX [Apiospora arundinis]|uniref:BZIP transcription factor HapX n=1 Tax=Apiospora arundinis TaxID=335852 RepID=A0ABR2I2N0_9PEZI
MAPPSANAVAPQSTRTVKVAIAPTSAAASPASAASPPSGIAPASQAPQLAIKPAANSPGPYSPAGTPSATILPQMPKTSITSKEWVIPPRPKPGRKPATDTPPTKRKAQNRAAQRAFRERRAARVGELEEQIEDIREEHEQIQQELQDEIQTLQARCATLETLLEKERTERTRTTNELDAIRRRWMDDRAASVASSRNNSLPGLSGRSYGPFSTASQHHTPRSSIASDHSGHRNSTTSFSISQIISPPEPEASVAESTIDTGCGSCQPNGACACVEEALAATAPSLDCGKCSLGTKCECLEAMLNGSASAEHELKRKNSSISNHGHEGKRQRSDVNENEIDFTAMFSKKRTSVVAPPPADDYQPPLQQHTIPPRDSCGFCTEGTYCMCAEAASAAAQATLAPIGSQVQTPPASEDDVVSTPLEVTSTGAIKLPRLQSLNRPAPAPKSGGCGPNGPGTCAQCVADPKSGLFCRSLAAKLNKDSGSGAPPSGCCGGSGSGGGCCKTAPSSSLSANPGPSSAPGVSLSCADAYKTLSSHRNFDRAADDIGTWLPQLRAVPHEAKGRLAESSGRSRHHPIEVEAASIMSVLKGFDVRFGREP